MGSRNITKKEFFENILFRYLRRLDHNILMVFCARKKIKTEIMLVIF